ncbi:MHO_4530 family protein [Mycoplasmopsis edwardii]|nr:hypothetical protein [Mycoplasmopsis edwardii]
MLYIYYRSSSGIIIFKVDKINNRVLRISNTYHFMSTIFDSKKSGFKEFNYISLDDFLEHFDKTSKDKFNNVFDMSWNENKVEVISVNINQKYRKNFTIWERLAVRFDKSITKTPEYQVTIRQDRTTNFICALRWNKASKKIQNLTIKNHKDSRYFSLNEKNLTVIGMMLKSVFNLKEIRNSDIYEIYSMFDFKSKKTFYFKEDGIIYFVLKGVSNKRYKEYQNIINDLNKNKYINKIFNYSTMFKTSSIKNEQDLINIKNMLKYSLYNIYSNNVDYSKYMFFDEKIIKNADFQDFINNLNKYDVINSSSDNEIKIKEYMITKYSTKQKGSLVLVECSLKDDVLDSKWIELFKKIFYLEYKYQKSWYSHIGELKKYNSSNSMFKVSQEVFLDQNFVPTTNKPICLVYANDNEFLANLLKVKIDKFAKDHKIYTALYIDRIDRTLINIINTIEKIKAIVIGENISQNLNDWSVFYDCLNLVKLAKDKNTRIIFEKPKKDLDSLIIEKLDIQFSFDS